MPEPTPAATLIGSYRALRRQPMLAEAPTVPFTCASMAELLRMLSADHAFKCVARATLPWHFGLLVIQLSGRKQAASKA
jgi:hypothetical protein